MSKLVFVIIYFTVRNETKMYNILLKVYG